METSKNSDIIIFLVTGMAVLFILAFAMILFFRLFKKRIIKQQQRIFEQEKKHQQDLLYSNIQSVETERKRIAKDIHDELGSIFSTLSLQLRKYPATPNNDLLTNSQQLIESGLTTVRRIAHEMMPPELELFGLEKALDNLVQRINAGGGPQATLHFEQRKPPLTENESLALYRVTQEMLSNTLKHARATEISISLFAENNNYYYRYTDNGVGLPASIKSSGMGLKNIESRAGMIGGEVLSGERPEKGFRCTIKIPLQPVN